MLSRTAGGEGDHGTSGHSSAGKFGDTTSVRALGRAFLGESGRFRGGHAPTRSSLAAARPYPGAQGRGMEADVPGLVSRIPAAAAGRWRVDPPESPALLLAVGIVAEGTLFY
jgi:hypothetical protein